MSISISQLNSCTTPHFNQTFVDNVYTGQIVLDRMRKGGRVKRSVDGGTSFYVPIRYKELGQAKFVDPDSERQTVQVDSRTAAEYERKYAVCDVVITWREAVANRGKPQMVDLVADKLKEGALDLQELISDALFQSYSSIGSNDLEGFYAIIRDPSSTTTLGGVSSADVPAWVAGVYYTSAVDLALYGSYSMDYGMRQCTYVEAPDMIITTLDLCSEYSSKLQPSERREPENGRAGATDLYFEGAPIVWDKHVDSGDMLFINTKNLWLFVDSEYDFSIEGWVDDPDRLNAARCLFSFSGAFGCDLRRHFGAYTAVS